MPACALVMDLRTIVARRLAPSDLAVDGADLSIEVVARLVDRMPKAALGAVASRG